MTYAENRRRSILRIENHPDAVVGCYQGEKDNIGACTLLGCKRWRFGLGRLLSLVPKGLSLLPQPLPLAAPGRCAEPTFSRPVRDSLSTLVPLSLTASRANPDRRDRRLFLSPEGSSFSPSAPPSSAPTCHDREPFSRQPLWG